MSLRPKIVLLLSAVMAIYASADFALQRRTVSRAFQAVEEEQAQNHVYRVVEALSREVEALHRVCLDWSAWDDAYEYVESHDGRFEKSNLGATTLANRSIDLLYLVAKDGTVLWAHAVDPDTKQTVRLRDFPTGRLHGSHPFLVREETDKTPHGLIATEHKPLLLSARPILTSERGGPARGTLILGRFLSAELDRVLTRQTRVDFDFWQVGARGALPPEVEGLRDELTSAARPVLRERDEKILFAYATVNDVRGRPEFLVRANVERQITATGSASVGYALKSTVIAGLLLLLALLALIQRTVLSPISKLTRHAVAIGRNEDFRAKLKMDRNDEIGVLSREFDQMMENLARARAAVADAARAAGKSEVATGILHNVGNVLNSVNVAATTARDRVQRMSVDDLRQVSEVLSQHANDLGAFFTGDPRAAHLQPFLSALAEQLNDERGELNGEIESLVQGIEHIRELIRWQNSFAGRSDLLEPVSVVELIDRALELTDKAMHGDASLEVVREFADVGEVLTDEHKVIEILVNVIQNARQAMDAQPDAPKRLTLRVEAAPGERLRISVRDTGIGIPPENVVKIFNLGFTTKRSGHGFGLHAAANAATELGGRLSAESDGPGKGATFTLEIPATKPAPLAESPA